MGAVRRAAGMAAQDPEGRVAAQSRAGLLAKLPLQRRWDGLAREQQEAHIDRRPGDLGGAEQGGIVSLVDHRTPDLGAGRLRMIADLLPLPVPLPPDLRMARPKADPGAGDQQVQVRMLYGLVPSAGFEPAHL